MIHEMATALRWCISLGAKFVRVVPGATATVVLATIVSQVAVLLAFFLPLKVVILLGSDRIPRYFPASFAEVDRDFLIVSLSLATVGFYGLYLLAERVIQFGTDYGTRRLLAKSHKMILFENQDEIAAKAYRRYSRALAGLVFILLALVVLGIIYPEMALLLLGFIATALVMFWLAQRFSVRFRDVLDAKLGTIVGTMGNMGFLLAFAYLVADFIIWSPPGLIPAIIAFLLTRQVLNRASGLVGNVSGLYRQRLRLDALFFHGKLLLADQREPDKSMWPLLMPERRQVWVEAVLNELAGDVRGTLTCHWHQTGVSNMAALRVEVQGQCDDYLVKLFDANCTSRALHEATLLAHPPERLPAFPLLGMTKIQQFHCHVYRLSQATLPDDQDMSKVIEHILTKLLGIEPPAALVQRYQRSRPVLWQRLDEQMFERLRLAVDKESMMLLKQIRADLDTLRRYLQGLPLTILNPDISAGTILLSEDGDACLLHWGRWSLEPLGAGWPVKDKALPGLREAVESAAEARPALSYIHAEQAELAALAFSFEAEFNRQRYIDALELLPALLERLRSLEGSAMPGTSHEVAG